MTGPQYCTRRATQIAAILFVTATASTMAAQMMLEAVPAISSDSMAAGRHAMSWIFALELTNGIASAGIALALYPILRRANEHIAVGYLGLRLIEGTLGIVGAVFLLALLKSGDGGINQLTASHDATFLAVLIVFSCGTLLFYPLLFTSRLVPRVLSVWGLLGGLMLLISCLSILFNLIDMGSTTDLVLSLPIWINEMVLAAWLFIRGFNTETQPGGEKIAR